MFKIGNIVKILRVDNNSMQIITPPQFLDKIGVIKKINRGNKYKYIVNFVGYNPNLNLDSFPRAAPFHESELLLLEEGKVERRKVKEYGIVKFLKGLNV